MPSAVETAEETMMYPADGSIGTDQEPTAEPSEEEIAQLSSTEKMNPATDQTSGDEPMTGASEQMVTLKKQDSVEKFLALYEDFLAGRTITDADDGWSSTARAYAVSVALNGAVFGLKENFVSEMLNGAVFELKETDYKSEFWKGVFQKIRHALKPKKEVEAEIVLSHKAAASYRLILIQIMMRMVLWLDCRYKTEFA